MNIRNSARAVMINDAGQVLLFKFVFNKMKDSKVLWVTPGGGLKDGENFEDALKREVFEELGVNICSSGTWIWTREVPFKGIDGDFISNERYYLVTIGDKEIILDNMTCNEKLTFKGYKWWDVQDILASNEEFGPPDIGKLVFEINMGKIPELPINIS